MRLPLYARILGWFLLNLLLLVVGFAAFAQAYFGISVNTLISGRAGQQVRSVSELLIDELRTTKPEGWSAVFQRYEKVYGVTLFLFGPRADWLAGATQPLPPGVRSQLERLRPPPPGAPGAGRPIVRWEDDPDRPPFSLIQTPGPLRYWALVPVELPTRNRRSPGVLVIASESLEAGGLFFDARPWLIAAGASVVFSALFWFPFVRRITKSIGKVRAATGRFAEGRFDEPAVVGSRDEIGALAGSVNQMAARLDGYISGQRRFLGDIAHELCAPLARTQMALGILEGRAAPHERERLADLREEVDHMAGLVNELLSFSRAALGGMTAEFSPVEVRPLVERVVARENALGADVEIRVPDGLRALGDAHLIERAIGNVVRNALRHAAAAGPITISGEAFATEVVLRVRDRGPGVPVAMLGQIFDPFFRVDAARTRESGGVGLGLAIVRTCVTACAGGVTARNHPGGGLEVEFRFAVG